MLHDSYPFGLFGAGAALSFGEQSSSSNGKADPSSEMYNCEATFR